MLFTVADGGATACSHIFMTTKTFMERSAYPSEANAVMAFNARLGRGDTSVRYRMPFKVDKSGEGWVDQRVAQHDKSSSSCCLRTSTRGRLNVNTVKVFVDEAMSFDPLAPRVVPLPTRDHGSLGLVFEIVGFSVECKLEPQDSSKSAGRMPNEEISFRPRLTKGSTRKCKRNHQSLIV